MPMPNSTTIKMVEIELSVLRSSALFTSLIRPVATWETSAMTISGRTAMIGLRKITSSRIRISNSVASRTICSARVLDCWLSSCWAADPVTPWCRPVPATSGLMSARSTLIASPAAVLEPLTTLLGMATSAVCTRRFGDGGPAVTPTMLWMCLASRDAATEPDLCRVGGGQLAAIRTGEHDDGRRGGHVPRLPGTLCPAGPRPGSTHNSSAGNCFRCSWSAGLATWRSRRPRPPPRPVWSATGGAPRPVPVRRMAPGLLVPGMRPPPAARRTAESVAYACLLLTMPLPRCLASVWDVVIRVRGSSGKARAQVSS